MPSFTFNKTSNPMMTFFVTTVEEYMLHGDAITDQLGEVEGFLAAAKEKLDPATFQTDLEDYNHFLLQTLDEYLNCLNYFRVVGPFECRKLLNQQRDYMDVKQPALKLLETEETIEKEIREAIDTIFHALDRVRDEMSEDTKDGILNVASHADEFTEATGMARFVEKGDMDDRMEYNFWLHFSRRLDFYDISEQMRDHLDAQQNDPDERHECIKDRLVGMEQEKFPAYMCTLDGYSDEEIEIAKKAVKNDKLERESVEKREVERAEDDNIFHLKQPLRPIDFDEANVAEPEKPLRDPGKADYFADIEKSKKNRKAEIIPIDRFRHAKREP